jgi:hypothetical protein
MRILQIVFFSLTTCIVLQAQPKINSPYSRYGIGDPLAQYFTAQAGMGGQSTAFHDPHHLNILNPASYAHLNTTVLETGINAKYSTYKSGSERQNLWSGNLSYFALGMTLRSPINEVLDKTKSPWKFGTAFALTPYSIVGYKTQTATTLPDVGRIVNNFEGSGGTYRVTWGAGAKYKNTAFGLNIGWMFGKTSDQNFTRFVDSLPTYITNFRQDVAIRGFVWNTGIMHDFILKNDVNNKDIKTEWITVGLTAQSNHKLKGTKDNSVIRSRSRNASGDLSSADTVFINNGQSFDLILPSTFSLAFQYVKANKLKLGLQYTIENWSAYENGANPARLKNTSSVSAGLEYIPDAASYNNYSKRIRYRFGGYYRQDARIINDKKVNDIGLTLGLGIPVILPRQGTSYVNAAFELGQIGAGTAISEKYIRINLGFTLNDNSWFYKRRFE